MSAKTHTATEQVHLLDEAFFIPQLNRYRRIWIYLPRGYHSNKKRYPVMYMQDGQNLFDEATAFSGEWEVDESMDREPSPCIVVGIDNGGLLRMTEYSTHDSEQFGKGEGKQYLDFLARTLKPYIDKNYRTRCSKKHTIIAGSSMGGLVSFYGGLYHPTVFGKIGILSPAFWISPGIEQEISKLAKPRKHSSQLYYFYGGGAEDPAMVLNMTRVAETMEKYAGATIQIAVNPDGHHSESCLKEEFPKFYRWISKV